MNADKNNKTLPRMNTDAHGCSVIGEAPRQAPQVLRVNCTPTWELTGVLSPKRFARDDSGLFEPTEQSVFIRGLLLFICVHLRHLRPML
jgi:hypothetical protein